MIDLNGLKKVCSELNKRLGIHIRLCDSSNKLIYHTSNYMPDDAKMSVIIPKTNKNYSIYAYSDNNAELDNNIMQIISVCLEPHLSNKTHSDVFRDYIYNKISSDIFVQMLTSLNIKPELTYRLYLVSCDYKQMTEVTYIVKELIDTDTGDMLISLSNEHLLLIKECSNEASPEEASDLAAALVQSINMEISGKNITVSVSEIFESLINIISAYKSASDALRLGLICSPNKNTFIAEKLRLEFFLDMLPQTVLREFLALHSRELISEAWDDKMVETVQSLFDNNLNLSVTSRELYTHRNTLVYRLDKIKKISGLDLKFFDDAVIFKILMVADKLINPN